MGFERNVCRVRPVVRPIDQPRAIEPEVGPKHYQGRAAAQQDDPPLCNGRRGLNAFGATGARCRACANLSKSPSSTQRPGTPVLPLPMTGSRRDDARQSRGPTEKRAKHQRVVGLSTANPLAVGAEGDAIAIEEKAEAEAERRRLNKDSRREVCISRLSGLPLPAPALLADGCRAHTVPHQSGLDSLSPGF